MNLLTTTLDRLNSKIRVLAIDDDPNVTWILSDSLNEKNFLVEYCNDGRAAIRKIATFHPDVCLLDIKMPGMNGIELLNYIKKTDPAISVIMVSGHADTPIVVQAVQGGADDFIVKPFDVEMVELCIYKVLEKKDLHQRVKRLETELAKQSLWHQFVGESESFRRVRELIEQVSATDLNILIRGESGTGKDLVARLIHQTSHHSRGPFVKINCDSLPGGLLESELFGLERAGGAEAFNNKPGRFEMATNGTVLLDEVGALPPAVQAGLLQALEHREFFRVGGTEAVRLNARLISTTSSDIEQRIQQESFRLDLFYRMSDITIHIPPLRERGEDISILAHYFLGRYCEKFAKTPLTLSPASERALMAYPWPGNVRELENLVKRVVIFGEEEIVKHLGAQPGGASAGYGPTLAPAEKGDRPLDPVYLPDSYFSDKTLKAIYEGIVNQVERRAIQMCLERLNWNRKRAAQELDISYRCLLYKIQEYNLQKKNAPVIPAAAEPVEVAAPAPEIPAPAEAIGAAAGGEVQP